MFKKWMGQLTSCKLFQGIKPDELNIMLGCLKPVVRDYDKNESIAFEGDSFSSIGIVISGQVVVTRESLSGDRMIMTILGPGEMFGEMAVFSKNCVWPANVTAQTDSTVMFLHAAKIVGECQNLCGSHRMLTLNMLKIVSEKAILLNRKVEYLTIKSMRGKICAFLLEQYNKSGKSTFMIPLKRNELADFLNVSRPSLSREMCRMRDEGIIDFHRESICIKDIEALKQM